MIPDRADWSGLKVRVDMVREGMDKVLDGLAGALEEAEEAELKALVRKRVAGLAPAGVMRRERWPR